MSAFIKSIQNTAATHSLWGHNSKLIIGVSGGPDSMCLLDVCVFLSKKYNWTLHIAHINYGLRKESSDQDEQLVRDTAEKYRIPCSVLKPKIKQQANLEEALRDIRYEFFEQLRQKHSYDAIVVAHTQNDQAETVLMRLIRGSGLAGLSAMRHRTGRIIRPLLDMNRKEIMRYLRQHSIKYRIDDSNKDLRFFRNKVRHRLIPYLEKHYNPSIQKILANTATTIADDHHILTMHLEPFPIPYQKIGKKIIFQASEFADLHIAVKRHVIRHLYSLLKGNAKNIENSNVNECLKMLQSTKSKTKTVSFLGLKITQRGDIVTITPV